MQVQDDGCEGDGQRDEHRAEQKVPGIRVVGDKLVRFHNDDRSLACLCCAPSYSNKTCTFQFDDVCL